MTAPDPRLGEIEARPIAFHKLNRPQLLTLAIALQDQRDNALAELRTAREALARVEAVAAEWEDLAGSGSDWERVYGKQKVSVEFAVSRIRAAIADPADPSTDPDGVALVEAIIERKAQEHDRS